MAEKLDNRKLAKLPAPAKGPKKNPSRNKIYYDSEVAGLGYRVTSANTRSFILNYRTRSGRERRYTIGPAKEWSVAAARDKAKELKRQIENGNDPLAAKRADREAPTIADLCKRFQEEHLPKKRPATQRQYRDVIDRMILPKLRHLKVAEVVFEDIDALHRKWSGKPYLANRCVAVLKKMFNLAIHWKWLKDNPAKGVEHYPEPPRHGHLSTPELVRLGEALAKHPDQQGANIIRLLLLTGARSGEVKAMRWENLDLGDGIWTKPGATTKQKTQHRVPLSAPARQLLVDLAREAEDGTAFVFPGRAIGHRSEVNRIWANLCATAQITGKRVHDLRHTYASILASSGRSLPIIGRLLGHTQPATTARYSDLMDDPLREATEHVGAVVTSNGKGGDVVPMKQGR